MRNMVSQVFQNQPSPVPSAWERFLADEGISESRCPSFLNCHTQERSVIQSWVLANYKTRYVPELVIQMLGLQRQLISTSRTDE